jgi:hypothetical protein
MQFSRSSPVARIPSINRKHKRIENCRTKDAFKQKSMMFASLAQVQQGACLRKNWQNEAAKVVLVEAGRQIPVAEYRTHSWPYELPNRSAPMPGYLPEVMDSVRYEDSDSIFVDRIRAVGGRSIHWNAVCLRFRGKGFPREKHLRRRRGLALSYQGLGS